MPINDFSGKNRWLSNFWPCEVKYEELIYPSSEHAYVAAKTLNLQDRLVISAIPTANLVKKYGRSLMLRPNWDNIRLEEMYKIVFDKFTRNIDLSEKLLATENQELVEGNWWGDRFWGVDTQGIGCNHLGKILMEVRRCLIKRKNMS